MLGKSKQPFEIQSIEEVHNGSITSMFDVTAILRTGKKGRPRKIRFVVFGKDALEAYQRGVYVLQKERGRDAQEQTK